jgi:hypothetical protein
MADILLPHAEPLEVEEGSTLAPRVPSLSGRSIGIVNNSWRCMNLIADELTARLRADYGVVDVREVRISAAQTLAEHQVEEMADVCDAIVVGIGN